MFHLHHGVFTPSECGLIAELGHAELAASQSDVIATPEGAGRVPAVRDSRVAWIPLRADTEWIHDRLAGVAGPANEAWSFEVDGFHEDLQFTVYDTVGAHYTWHHDGLDDGVEHRKLSMVVQLSDPGSHDGGDLEFLEVAEDYSAEEKAEYLTEVRRQGTVVSFPAFEYHRVTPLRGGTRLSLVAWLAGPPFR